MLRRVLLARCAHLQHARSARCRAIGTARSITRARNVDAGNYFAAADSMLERIRAHASRNARGEGDRLSGRRAYMVDPANAAGSLASGHRGARCLSRRLTRPGGTAHEAIVLRRTARAAQGLARRRRPRSSRDQRAPTTQIVRDTDRASAASRATSKSPRSKDQLAEEQGRAREGQRGARSDQEDGWRNPSN